LHIGEFQVVRTYATPGQAVSGIRVTGDGSVEPPKPRTDKSTGTGGRARTIKGPPGDRRNSTEEIRTFAFRIAGLWPYLRRRHRVTIRVDGRPLPIYRHGMFLRPRRDGELGLDELKRRFADGYVLSQMGQVQLSKQLDTEWQLRSMELYTRVRTILAEEHGYDAFLMYGTLLGAVRDGGYIGHDADFDAGYVSRCRTGPDAAAELAEIAMTMIRHGFGADLRARLLHVHDPDDHEFHIDLFHTYFDNGVHRFPFGIAGTTRLLESDWTGTHDIDFPGGRAAIPDNAEQLVEHLYGDDWRRPRPGFNWSLDRTDQAEEAQLTERIGVSDRVRFSVCDVGDVAELGRLIDEVVEAASGPVLFYLRFFLHAIPETVQERMLGTIQSHSRPGDLFAAEFRTDKDASRAKVHGKHYRRFQSAEEFRGTLTERLGFEVLDEVESTGLSPYGDEDPVLYRVVARRLG
jgi:hypothetical protein